MILDAAKLANATKSIFSQKPGSHEFSWIANIVLNKGKSAKSHLVERPEVLPSACNKTKLFKKNPLFDESFDNLCITLTVFLSRTNLKKHKIHVSAKLLKKVINNLDLSKVSGRDCIPVVVLKKCNPELSYIPSELFNICQKKILFFRFLKGPICGPCIKKYWGEVYD